MRPVYERPTVLFCELMIDISFVKAFYITFCDTFVIESWSWNGPSRSSSPTRLPVAGNGAPP